MKKVLFISYIFPPAFDAGTFRSLKFIKYIRNYNWEPIVITKKIFHPQEIGVELLNQIEKNIQIIKIFSISSIISNIANKLKINTRYFLFPDDHIFWFPLSFIYCINIIMFKKINVVYTTSEPWTTHLIGLFLKLLTNKPWVADVRDPPWSLDPDIKFPTKFHKKLMQLLERKIFEKADSVVVVTDDMKIQIGDYFNIDNKISVITNGYDHEDTQNIELHKNNEIFNICYTGSFDNFRTPDNLIESMNKLLKEKEFLKDKIKIVIAGIISKKSHDLIRQYRLENVFDLKGVVSYKKSIELILNSEIALLILPSVGVGKRNVALTQKIFNYFLTNKPILGLVADSPARDLLIKSKAGYVVDPDDIDGIMNLIYELYIKYTSKTLKINPNIEIIRQYDRKILTGKLTAIFDDLITSQ